MSYLDELIKKRRSIRKYKEDVPPAEWIEKMVYCASRAPSPSNSQPVRFIKINSLEIQSRLHNAMAKGYEKFLQKLETKGGSKRLKNWINTYWRFSEFMFSAPVLLAVGTLTDVSSFSKRLFEAGILPKDSRMDTDVDIAIGLALKGFLLKGVSLGLGSCILTAPLVFISNTEEILGLKDIRIKCFVTVGIPDESPGFIKRKQVSEIYREI